jgi:hypothetical protein
MLGLLLSTACSVMPALATRAQPATPPTTSGGLLLSAADFADLRAHPNTLDAPLQRCPTLLQYTSAPVAVLAPAPHYTANGVNSDNPNDKQLAKDAQAAYTASLCFKLTGDTRYASAAQHILDAWADTLQAVTTPQGRDNINFNIPYMITAASWVQGEAGWNSRRFTTFLRKVALPNAELSNPNNHGVWAVLMTASAAAYLHDPQLLATARNRFQTLLIGAIDADGSLPREISRSGTSNYHGGPDKGVRGLAYTHYFLLPASLAAKVFSDQGQPIWQTQAGKLLGAAFGRAAGWTLHPETFPYYASNHGQLQDTHNAPYFALLLRYYPNADAQAVLEQSALGQGALEQSKIPPGGFYLMSLFPINTAALPAAPAKPARN